MSGRKAPMLFVRFIAFVFVPIWLSLSMPGCGVMGAPGETAGIDGPTVVPDGSGGAMAVYQVGEGNGRNTYVQRIGPEGQVLWGERGTPLFFAPGAGGGIGLSARVAAGGNGGVVLAWTRHDDGRIELQRVSPEGRFLWEKGAPQLVEGGPLLHMVVSDGSGGVFAAWGGRVRIQRIDGRGRALWPADVLLAEGQGRYLNMAPDRQGGVLLVWDDSGYNVVVQKLGPGGDVLWGPDGVRVVAGEGAGKTHSIVTDGMGGAIAVFETAQRDQTGFIGGSDLFAQRVDPGGRVLWQADGIPIARGSPFDAQGVEDGTGGVIAVWRTDVSIYAQRMDGAGKLLWAREGVEVWNGGGSPAPPVVSILVDGAGGAVIVWHQPARGSPLDGGQELELRAQRLGSNGQTLWGSGGVLAGTGRGYLTRPVVSGDGSGGVIVVWAEGPGVHRVTSSYVQRIDAGGNPRFGKKGVKLGG
ncbi:MAG: hypothetical protein HY673_27220 [Chloroflexi bacterium]|nr:hypothetical protein [Chloroflexota bacterium]